MATVMICVDSNKPHILLYAIYTDQIFGLEIMNTYCFILPVQFYKMVQDDYQNIPSPPQPYCLRQPTAGIAMNQKSKQEFCQIFEIVFTCPL